MNASNQNPDDVLTPEDLRVTDRSGRNYARSTHLFLAGEERALCGHPSTASHERTTADEPAAAAHCDNCRRTLASKEYHARSDVWTALRSFDVNDVVTFTREDGSTTEAVVEKPADRDSLYPIVGVTTDPGTVSYLRDEEDDARISASIRDDYAVASWSVFNDETERVTDFELVGHHDPYAGEDEDLRRRLMHAAEQQAGKLQRRVDQLDKDDPEERDEHLELANARAAYGDVAYRLRSEDWSLEHVRQKVESKADTWENYDGDATGEDAFKVAGKRAGWLGARALLAELDDDARTDAQGRPTFRQLADERNAVGVAVEHPKYGTGECRTNCDLSGRVLVEFGETYRTESVHADDLAVDWAYYAEYPEHATDRLARVLDASRDERRLPVEGELVHLPTGSTFEVVDVKEWAVTPDEYRVREVGGSGRELRWRTHHVENALASGALVLGRGGRRVDRGDGVETDGGRDVEDLERGVRRALENAPDELTLADTERAPRVQCSRCRGTGERGSIAAPDQCDTCAGTGKVEAVAVDVEAGDFVTARNGSIEYRVAAVHADGYVLLDDGESLPATHVSVVSDDDEGDESGATTYAVRRVDDDTGHVSAVADGLTADEADLAERVVADLSDGASPVRVEELVELPADLPTEGDLVVRPTTDKQGDPCIDRALVADVYGDGTLRLTPAKGGRFPERPYYTADEYAASGWQDAAECDRYIGDLPETHGDDDVDRGDGVETDGGRDVDPVADLLAELEETPGVIKCDDRTGRAYKRIPGGLEAGVRKVELVAGDEWLADRYFREWSARDDVEVFHVPDARFADGEDPRRLLLVPVEDAGDVSVWYCGATMSAGVYVRAESAEEAQRAAERLVRPEDFDVPHVDAAAVSQADPDEYDPAEVRTEYRGDGPVTDGGRDVEDDELPPAATVDLTLEDVGRALETVDHKRHGQLDGYAQLHHHATQLFAALYQYEDAARDARDVDALRDECAAFTLDLRTHVREQEEHAVRWTLDAYDELPHDDDGVDRGDGPETDGGRDVEDDDLAELVEYARTDATEAARRLVDRGENRTLSRECPDCGDVTRHQLVGMTPADATTGAWGKYMNPVYGCEGCETPHVLLRFDTGDGSDRPELAAYEPEEGR